MKPTRAQVSNCLDVSNKSSMLQETMIKQYICGTNSFSLRNHHRFALISDILTARICSEARMERHIKRQLYPARSNAKIIARRDAFPVQFPADKYTICSARNKGRRTFAKTVFGEFPVAAMIFRCAHEPLIDRV